MELSKVNFNSLNLTPTASKTVVFNSNNNGIEAGDVGGSLVLISTQTASSSSTIDFTSGIDSTYKEYIFKIINCHPSTDDVPFQFQVDTGTNTNYNQTMTTVAWQSAHAEADNDTSLEYRTELDLAQSTGFHGLSNNIGNGNDECISGTLHLFDPSNTTFVKHFNGQFSGYGVANYNYNSFSAGYVNTTTAVTRLRFKFSSGNIDSGTIKLYGVT